jgi:hypothetical protein
VSVGEICKVMTQVDHDLTPVNEFDRQLGLIKNLGRHNCRVLALGLFVVELTNWLGEGVVPKSLGCEFSVRQPL